MQNAKLFLGDSSEVLKTLGSNSIDALVCDPPAGIGFMSGGKKDHWDSNKGGRDEWIAWLASVMRECYRVMKPGAHGLVWALPRTSHWTAMALEHAGFEVRDRVSHLFGSGFPKSLDVSKAIDKAAGASRAQKDMTQIEGERMIAQTVHAVCNACNKRQFSGNPCICPDPSKEAITDAAKTWQGWGTALKPACEDWWLVRKPLSEKTVAANVLKWGTGALNIDCSRIQGGGPKGEGGRLKGATGSSSQFNAGKHNPVDDTQGRFPSHLVLSCACPDDTQHELSCAVAMLDAQSGVSKSTGGMTTKRTANIGEYGFKSHLRANTGGLGDSGGASRFYYVAKVSRSERNAAGENRHPTVKSLKLMRYLARLVTPPGGIILDCFAGSGSTACAAIAEGFKFVGIEKESEYHAIATKRLEHAASNVST